MALKTCAIIGASKNRRKYSNKAVRAYVAAGYKVYPITKQGGVIEGLRSYKVLTDVPSGNIDIIALYVRPEIGLSLLANIIQRHPTTVFSPKGTINDALRLKASQLGLELTEACSIIATGYHPNDL